MKMLPENCSIRGDAATVRDLKYQKMRRKKSQIKRRRSSRLFVFNKQIFSQTFLGFFLHMCRRK